MPDRISRTHVVPGNIMSVEFKLFDFMTLKQFLYLVVCSFISYLLITFLPDGIFKFLFPTIVMIAGIVIAFVQFNGEPFEVYTTNFILGVIQPQRRVWSKTPIKRTVVTDYEGTASTTQNAMKSLADSYVPEEEIIPVDFNKSVTDVDLQEMTFLKSNKVEDTKVGNSSANLPKADLSQLNFDFAIQSADIVESKNIENVNSDQPDPNAKPLINLNPLDNSSKSDNMLSEKNDVNLNLNTNDMNPQSPINTPGNVSSVAPAFVINMDDDDNKAPVQSESQFVPLAQDLPQEERVQAMPDIQLNLAGNDSVSPEPVVDVSSPTPLDTNANDMITGSLMEDLKELQHESSSEMPMPAPVAETIQPEPVLAAPVLPESTPEVIHDVMSETVPNSLDNLNIAPVVVPNTEPTVESQPVASTPMPAPSNDSVIGKIHGKVISADLTSQPGLVVTMCDSDGKALEAVITNEHGEYVFQTMPKSFQLKVFPPKKYLFSPMDKQTKEIIIHEVPADGAQANVTTVFKQNSQSTSVDSLETAKEMDAMDAKVPNTINGVVKDDKGHYLAGVLVSIKDATGITIRALATNPLGQFFSHSPLPNGKFTIHFEKDGVKFDNFEVQLEGKVYPAKVYVGKVINMNE